MQVSLPAPVGSLLGASLTLNISECPNDAEESLLSQVLLGGGLDPRKVLFERPGVRRDSTKSSEAGEGVAAFAESSFGTFRATRIGGTLKAQGGFFGGGDETLVAQEQSVYDMSHANDVVRESKQVPTLQARMGTGGNQIPLVLSQGMRGNVVASAHVVQTIKTGSSASSRNMPLVMTSGGRPSLEQVAYRICSYCSNSMKSSNRRSGIYKTSLSPTLDVSIPTPAKGQGGLCIVLSENGTDRAVSVDITPPLKTTTPCYCLAENTIGREPKNGGNGLGVSRETSFTLNATGVHGVMTQSSVRRLTPVECERLQGFPDNWTRIPYRGRPEEKCPDSPRYKAIGNSWAVPVVRWIGKRIKEEIEK